MKLKISIFLSLAALCAYALFAGQTIQAANQTKEAQLLLQIQQLQQEVLRLQTLLLIIQAESQPHLAVSAEAYLATNLQDNSVLAAKNANQPHIIASLTKLMNAVVALEHIGPNQTIQLTPRMLKPDGLSPSLYAGLTISRDNLLKASLIQSTNDAAEALSYFIGKERFLQLMNQKAQDLGMARTVFYDTHGLNPANTSTATDLAKLVAYVSAEHPEIWHITKDTHFQLPDSAGAQLTFKNMNTFYDLTDFMGGKTGWIPEAKQTYASVFQINGDPVAIVVLASEDRKADVLSIVNSLKTRTAL